mmetsp:Transcript_12718/g.35939  ORF Transcript_12718/g.35939 Transcript_12718/m.35939 type:complete len:491 (+) Transcript_12718:498-1970(+)
MDEQHIVIRRKQAIPIPGHHLRGQRTQEKVNVQNSLDGLLEVFRRCEVDDLDEVREGSQALLGLSLVVLGLVRGVRVGIVLGVRALVLQSRSAGALPQRAVLGAKAGFEKLPLTLLLEHDVTSPIAAIDIEFRVAGTLCGGRKTAKDLQGRDLPHKRRRLRRHLEGYLIDPRQILAVDKLLNIHLPRLFHVVAGRVALDAKAHFAQILVNVSVEEVEIRRKVHMAVGVCRIEEIRQIFLRYAKVDHRDSGLVKNGVVVSVLVLGAVLGDIEELGCGGNAAHERDAIAPGVAGVTHAHVRNVTKGTTGAAAIAGCGGAYDGRTVYAAVPLVTDAPHAAHALPVPRTVPRTLACSGPDDGPRSRRTRRFGPVESVVAVDIGVEPVASSVLASHVVRPAHILRGVPRDIEAADCQAGVSPIGSVRVGSVWIPKPLLASPRVRHVICPHNHTQHECQNQYWTNPPYTNFHCSVTLLTNLPLSPHQPLFQCIQPP